MTVTILLKKKTRNAQTILLRNGLLVFSEKCEELLSILLFCQFILLLWFPWSHLYQYANLSGDQMNHTAAKYHDLNHVLYSIHNQNHVGECFCTISNLNHIEVCMHYQLMQLNNYLQHTMAEQKWQLLGALVKKLSNI